MTGVELQTELGNTLLRVAEDHPGRADLNEGLTRVKRFSDADFFWILPRLQETPTPDRVPELIDRGKELGFEYDHIVLPQFTFRDDTNYPEKDWVHLSSWLFPQIAEGNIDPDAITVSAVHLLVDTAERPNYQNGLQLYAGGNDPWSCDLANLRRQGAIEVTGNTKHIPKISRFGISALEIDNAVAPLHKEQLGVNIDGAEQVRSLSPAEYNVVGNFRHPELGAANTYEWLHGRFGRGSRLFGGDSGYGGLGSVGNDVAGNHRDSIGFRLGVFIPQLA